MDSVKPFLDWRRARVSDVHNHHVVNHHIHGGEFEALVKRVEHLEERLSAGASMRDLQLVAQSVVELGDKVFGIADRLTKAEDDSAYALKHAIVDARLTEDKMQ